MSKQNTVPLYSRHVNKKAAEKIDKIVETTGAQKWQVVDTLLCKVLGVKNSSSLDLSRWTKTNG